MKNVIIFALILLILPSAQPVPDSTSFIKPSATSRNLFIITLDGFRWQELFTGADSALINDPNFTPDAETIKTLYWADTEKERRKKLMPFFWSIISKKGQLYGNRELDNKVNTANIYAVSYPGYHELLTGSTDLLVSSNNKKAAQHANVLAYLNTKEEFKGKVAAFSSWDVFPYILNEEKSGIIVNSGYENMAEGTANDEQLLIDRVQTEMVTDKGGTRHDQLTFLSAREYIKDHKPRVALVGLGETDEYAHGGRYDLYLEQANKTDQMIAEFWHWIQTTPGYKDNTTLIITTDHGRGRGSKWTSHSAFIKGSSQTWMAMLGAGVEELGEMKNNDQHYQKEIAGLIANFVGEEFVPKDFASLKK